MSTTSGLWLPSGSYVLTVGDRVGTGTFSFALLAVPDPQSFSINLGDTVSPGTPAPGAGDLESPGAEDVYSFAAGAGEEISVSGTDCAAAFSFALVAPSGRQLLRDSLCGSDDVLDLPGETGTYTLWVTGAGSMVGTYSLRIAMSTAPTTATLPSADVLAIAPGGPVISGAIGAPGNVADYTFTGSAGASVNLDIGGGGWYAATLYGPDGLQVGAVTSSGAPEAFSLGAPGTFEVEISAINGTATGAYSFVLSSPTDSTSSISVGGTVTVPSELEGSVDEYTFDDTVGSQVSIDSRDGFNLQLIGPDGFSLGTEEESSSEPPGGFIGPHMFIPQTGVYTIMVFHDPLFPGAGSLNLRGQAPNSYRIAVGTTVAPNQPHSGAGELTVVGGINGYVFSGRAGERVALEERPPDCGCNLGLDLFGPQGEEVAATTFETAATVQSEVLPESGLYAIEVQMEPGYYETANYSFSLLPSPPFGTFRISPGATVTPGSRAGTARQGTVSSPGAIDEYMFLGEAGESVSLENQQVSPTDLPLSWFVYAPDGAPLGNGLYSQSGFGEPFVLPESGVYTLEVTTDQDPRTGTYGFQLAADPMAPTQVRAAPRDGAVVVSWTRPSTRGTGLPRSYEVTVLNPDGGPAARVRGAPSRDAGWNAPFTFTGLTNGFSYAFEVQALGTLGDGRSSPISAPSTPVRTILAAGGAASTCVLLPTGHLDCWGRNDEGQLGDGTTTTHRTPAGVETIRTAVSIAVGGDHACALLRSGTVDCWGANESGELGDGTTRASAAPVRVRELPRAIAVSVGAQFSCALLSTGDVDCWGQNNHGELGHGGVNTGARPSPVRGLAHAVAVAAGMDHACALISAGTVKCWGLNASGQLGNGSTNSAAAPVSVRGLKGVAAISAGGQHTCALLSSGSVKCWGLNSWGQLGDGHTKSSSVPVSVRGLSSAVSIAAGGDHTCALLPSGSVECWGLNESGQLGNGSTSRSTTPVRVVDLANVVSVSAGQGQTVVRLASGGLRAWGSDAFGQLGDGGSRNADVPVAVVSLR